MTHKILYHHVTENIRLPLDIWAVLYEEMNFSLSGENPHMEAGFQEWKAKYLIEVRIKKQMCRGIRLER